MSLTARGISQSSTSRAVCAPAIIRMWLPRAISSLLTSLSFILHRRYNRLVCPTIGRCATAVCNAVWAWLKAGWQTPLRRIARSRTMNTARRGCFNVPLVRSWYHGGTCRGWKPILSPHSSFFFFPAASSWRSGHLLSKISASLIFALLPDHSSIAIPLEKVLSSWTAPFWSEETVRVTGDYRLLDCGKSWVLSVIRIACRKYIILFCLWNCTCNPFLR